MTGLPLDRCAYLARHIRLPAIAINYLSDGVSTQRLFVMVNPDTYAAPIAWTPLMKQVFRTVLGGFNLVNCLDCSALEQPAPRLSPRYMSLGRALL